MFIMKEFCIEASQMFGKLYLGLLWKTGYACADHMIYLH